MTEISGQPSVPASLSLLQDELAAAADGLQEDQLAGLVNEIRQARRVFVTGGGRSGLALRMHAMRLMHLGLTVHVVGETTTPAIGPGDLLIVASGSGTTAGAVAAAETAVSVDSRVAALTTDGESKLAGIAHHVVLIPAAQKTDHRGTASRQYSGSLFEQALLLVLDAVFHTLWKIDGTPAEDLWPRHANLE
ncbi:6-phospho-3-hexuloisomerase [Arthrobacter sp. zg-Y20]|uniref:6-phospho-3-hexuloisomerase n=1 Tax=unclassified Arthrobacter TaxID=235627 RepID=UPI001D13C4B3|nr:MULTISPECIES: 6-phospho-3-hexuloisomerase [unclassified Arthrobacter]MCC3276281.1 6-phospho-3-hexuloisomerase [Arthrobacter sp. zg-Y20]MDK1316440.1 6-phospho-3-hexuloisomerase [Arthrobacter sp. zg.Y20]WIB06485.1 6-phospho-3-hexuloisomerase [Arthrobacter sp. zg-Y20]